MGSGIRLSILLLNVFIARTLAQIIYGTYWFNDDQKRRIIQMHNQLRASEPASNMQELVWDDRLAALAHGHVQRCDAWHRSAYERRGNGYSYIGENIWWSNEAYLRANIESAIVDFYSEKPFYNYVQNECFGPQCGHYTQLVWATTCAVGCAAVRCDGIKNGRGILGGHILVCNYGEGGNVFGERPYLAGPRCSQCADGGGCTSEGLCAPRCFGVRYPRFLYQAATEHVILKRTNQLNNATLTSSRVQKQSKSPVHQIQVNSGKEKKMMKQVLPHIEPCQDRKQHCAEWAKHGRCRGSYHRFMAKYCQFSCHLCIPKKP